jgi:hypothetical protein
MAAINVTLRIVGLYLNAPVNVDDNNPISVEDVMKSYVAAHPIAAIGGLSYRATGDFMTSISHNYLGKFDFDGDGEITSPIDGPTLGGNTRPLGKYTLTERSLNGGKARLIWQYYVVSPQGKVKSKTDSSRGFQNFKTPLLGENAITAGDTITWRLVAIGFRP